MFPYIHLDDLKKMIQSNPDLLKQWVVVVSECYQYAEGICGQDYSAMIIFKEVDFDTSFAKGFDKKGDWRKTLDSKWIRSVTKKKINGKPSPYGEVGAKYRITNVVKFGDIIYPGHDEGSYFFKDLNRYFHYSSPKAVDGREHLKKEN